MVLKATADLERQATPVLELKADGGAVRLEAEEADKPFSFPAPDANDFVEVIQVFQPGTPGTPSKQESGESRIDIDSKEPPLDQLQAGPEVSPEASKKMEEDGEVNDQKGGKKKRKKRRKKKKKPFRLPHECRTFGYVAAFCWVAACCFCIVLYGLMFDMVETPLSEAAKEDGGSTWVHHSCVDCSFSVCEKVCRYCRDIAETVQPTHTLACPRSRIFRVLFPVRIPGVSVSTRWVYSVSLSNIQDAFVTDPASLILAGTVSAVFGDYITEQMEKLFACLIDRDA